MIILVKLTACQIPLIQLENFQAFEQQVKELFQHIPLDSDYVLLPELCTLGLLTTYADFNELNLQDYRRITIHLDAYKILFQNLSKERQQIIIAGTTLEEIDGIIYNTAFIFEPTGEISTHRKTHIFPAEAQWQTAEGNELNVFEIGPVKFGIAICYEIEVPEIATYYQRQGADIIFCPSYTFTQHGFWRVRHCAQARAVENQVYVVHCPTKSEEIGIINPGFGQASILSPCDIAWTANGVLAEGNETQFIVSAELSLEDLYKNRQTGAATTVKDRLRRKSLYSKYSLSL